MTEMLELRGSSTSSGGRFDYIPAVPLDFFLPPPGENIGVRKIRHVLYSGENVQVHNTRRRCNARAGAERACTREEELRARAADSFGFELEPAGRAARFSKHKKSYEISRASGETFNAPRSGVVGPRLSLI